MEGISALAKQVTTTTTKGSNGTVMYGTATGDDSVTIDGATSPTPATFAVEAKSGDRVMLRIMNHAVTVTSNLTDVSSGTAAVETVASDLLTVADAAKKASDLAETASQAAEAATTDAATAKAKAEEAATDAATAATKATEAATSASNAEESATSASKSATAAASDAASAKASAEAATTDASTAGIAASRAQAAAEAAETASSEAKAKADSAATDASTASTKATEAAASAAKTATKIVTEYATGTSQTTAPTSGWSSKTPTYTAGTYTWMHNVVTYGDGSKATTSPVLVTGNTGAKGEKGDTGAQGIQGIQGEKGETGAKGADGVSPTVTTSKSGDTTTIKITDASGTKTATITDGQDADIAAAEAATKAANDAATTATSAAGTATTAASNADKATTAANDAASSASSAATSATSAASKATTATTNANTATSKANTATTNANAAAAAAAKVNATVSGTTLTVTDNTGKSTSVDTKGEQGEKGDTGAQGIQGIQGEKGETGAKGATGEKGEPGTDGASVSTVAVQYASGTSQTTAPTSGWQSEVPELKEGSYVWIRSVTTITAADGTTTTDYGTPALYLALDGLASDVRTAQSTADTAKDTAESAQTAANDTREWFWHDSQGAHVCNGSKDGQSVSNSRFQTDITSTGLQVIDVQDAYAPVASFGVDSDGNASTQLGKTTGFNVAIDADRIRFRHQNNVLANFSNAEIAFENDSGDKAVISSSKMALTNSQVTGSVGMGVYGSTYQVTLEAVDNGGTHQIGSFETDRLTFAGGRKVISEGVYPFSEGVWTFKKATTSANEFKLIASATFDTSALLSTEYGTVGFRYVKFSPDAGMYHAGSGTYNLSLSEITFAEKKLDLDPDVFKPWKEFNASDLESETATIEVTFSRSETDMPSDDWNDYTLYTSGGFRFYLYDLDSLHGDDGLTIISTDEGGGRILGRSLSVELDYTDDTSLTMDNVQGIELKTQRDISLYGADSLSLAGGSNGITVGSDLGIQADTQDFRVKNDGNELIRCYTSSAGNNVVSLGYDADKVELWNIYKPNATDTSLCEILTSTYTIASSLASGGSATKTFTVTKSGYTPMGLIGFHFVGSTYANGAVGHAWLTDRSVGQGTIHVTVRNVASKANTIKGAFYVLWAKGRG